MCAHIDTWSLTFQYNVHSFFVILFWQLQTRLRLFGSYRTLQCPVYFNSSCWTLLHITKAFWVTLSNSYSAEHFYHSDIFAINLFYGHVFPHVFRKSCCSLCCYFFCLPAFFKILLCSWVIYIPLTLWRSEEKSERNNSSESYSYYTAQPERLIRCYVLIEEALTA
jgi:hypothetical protein